MGSPASIDQSAARRANKELGLRLTAQQYWWLDRSHEAYDTGGLGPTRRRLQALGLIFTTPGQQHGSFWVHLTDDGRRAREAFERIHAELREERDAKQTAAFTDLHRKLLAMLRDLGGFSSDPRYVFKARGPGITDDDITAAANELRWVGFIQSDWRGAELTDKGRRWLASHGR